MSVPLGRRFCSFSTRRAFLGSAGGGVVSPVVVGVPVVGVVPVVVVLVFFAGRVVFALVVGVEVGRAAFCPFICVTGRDGLTGLLAPPRPCAAVNSGSARTKIARTN